MNTANFFHTIESPSIAEFKDRGSRFIAYAYPLADVNVFKEKLSALKKEHHKAVHHCFAYRLGTDGNNFRVSDDGEPAGSAGRPILGQIDSRQLTNVMIIVVRYFGGTLLGVPGLIHAYKTSASMSLEAAVIVKKPVLIHYRLQFDYTQMNDVMRLLRQYDCEVVERVQELFCLMHIGIPRSAESDLLKRLGDFPHVTYEKIG